MIVNIGNLFVYFVLLFCDEFNDFDEIVRVGDYIICDILFNIIVCFMLLFVFNFIVFVVVCYLMNEC